MTVPFSVASIEIIIPIETTTIPRTWCSAISRMLPTSDLVPLTTILVLRRFFLLLNVDLTGARGSGFFFQVIQFFGLPYIGSEGNHLASKLVFQPFQND